MPEYVVIYKSIHTDPIPMNMKVRVVRASDWKGAVGLMQSNGQDVMLVFNIKDRKYKPYMMSTDDVAKTIGISDLKPGYYSYTTGKYK